MIHLIEHNKYRVDYKQDIDQLKSNVELSGQFKVIKPKKLPSFPAVVVLFSEKNNYRTHENGFDYMFFAYVTENDFKE